MFAKLPRAAIQQACPKVIIAALRDGHLAALGMECPLLIPVPTNRSMHPAVRGADVSGHDFDGLTERLGSASLR
jgi:hypothetical protein